MHEDGDEGAQIDADELLGIRAIEAGVAALAQRNRHHLADMTENEQAEAVSLWRDMTVDILGAARAAVVSGEGPAPDDEGPGRAVIILEDTGEEEVGVHVSFSPQLEDLGNGTVAGTPAQITAMSLLDVLAGGEGAEDGR